MNQDLVSIIVPVYGVAQYLPECVDSILAQTHRNLEVLLIDDASPDACGAICDAYAAQDDRVKVIHKPNGGAASARNAGLDAARGGYICFVDSDDTVSPEYVAKLLNALKQENADIAICGFRQRGKNERTVCAEREPSGVYDGQRYLSQFLRSWTCALLWNKIYRREVIGSIRMVEGRRIDDEFFTYQVVMNAGKIVVFDDPLYDYRLRRSSVMQDPSANGGQLLLDRIDYMQRRYGHVCEKAAALKDDFFADLVDSYARYWTGCAGLPEVKRRIRKWAVANLGRLLASKLTVKQKLIYVNALFFKPPGGRDLNESLSADSRNLYS